MDWSDLFSTLLFLILVNIYFMIAKIEEFYLLICQILPDAERRTWRSREGVWPPPENNRRLKYKFSLLLSVDFLVKGDYILEIKI